VAVDWQKSMVRERNAAATAHTTAPINHGCTVQIGLADRIKFGIAD